MKPSTLFLMAASTAFIGAMILGVSLMDSPQQARMQKLDGARIASLQRLNLNINNYRRAHAHLPERLDQLNISERDVKDPVTAAPYEYKLTAPDAYELCATFDAATPADEERNSYMGYNECQWPYWKHGKGRQCFPVSTKGCK